MIKSLAESFETVFGATESSGGNVPDNAVQVDKCSLEQMESTVVSGGLFSPKEIKPCKYDNWVMNKQ